MIQILLTLFLSHVFASPPQQPIIGVITQKRLSSDQTYIAASYVKNLEMAGAQVVPIFYHSSESEIRDLLGKVNGVLLPGGAMLIEKGNEWTDKVQLILDYAISENKKGNVYPIWGTCLGFEALMYLTSGESDRNKVFTPVSGQSGIVHALTIKSLNSTLLKKLSPEERHEMINGGLFYFNHKNAVARSTFEGSYDWSSFWRLVTTSKTESGLEFVSTVQGLKYPFYGTQYHPEKNSFEWRVNAVRTSNAISASQKLINTFVDDARRNRNQFDEQELQGKLIYNFQPFFTNSSSQFVQVYAFTEQ